MSFLGYERLDGTIGVRNHILVIPTVVCANEVATQITIRTSNTIGINHQHGCLQLGPDLDQTSRTLSGIIRNPNVAAAVIIGLGCETLSAKRIVDESCKHGKEIETLMIQDEGGTIKTVKKGIKKVKSLIKKSNKNKRRKFKVSELTVGLECGGSDATSGIISNPAVGYMSDLIVTKGGTVILSEITELIGAEHILAQRTINKKVARNLTYLVQRMENRAKAVGVDIRGSQPTPGNIEGGLTTIEEKALGAIIKAGSSTIHGVLKYAERPSGKGLYVMDTPGHDVESVSAMSAGGAQVIVFTTGRGTPTGSPVSPVIKITGNSYTYNNLRDNIDIDVSTILRGEETTNLAGERIFKELVAVASGKLTKAEILGHREFAINRTGPTL